MYLRSKVRHNTYPIDDYQIIKQEKEGLSPWKLRLYNSHSIGADIAESIHPLLDLLSNILELVSANITDVHKVNKLSKQCSQCKFLYVLILREVQIMVSV